MSWRTTPLPPNWQSLRLRILERDNHRCTATQHHPHCDGTATHVDHVIPASQGGTDHPDNLTSLSAPCHRTKTAREAGAGRAAKPQRTRPTPPHPGLCIPGA